MRWIIVLFAALAGIPSGSKAVEIKTEDLGDLRLLALVGEFLPDDDPRQLSAAIATFRPDVVTFDSPGGNIYSAMAFGRILRLHGVNTIQLRGTNCTSACALVFFGGVVRAAEPGAIGVHKTSFVDKDTLPTEAQQP